MAFIPTFHPDLKVAQLKDEETGMQVSTILPDTSRETSSILAYIGARFSRSDKSLLELAKESRSRGNEAQRLEKIFSGYGHRSVGDQARLIISLENIPDFEAMYILYRLPHYAAQQRSTRYQDFSNSDIPFSLEEIESDSRKERFARHYKQAIDTYKNSYEPIYNHLRERFNDADEKTLHTRTLDCSRNLLPAGIPTNLIIYTDARTVSELTSRLMAGGKNRRLIASLIYNLLTGDCHANEETNPVFKRIKEVFGKGYQPEARRLIRHTEADLTQNQFIKDLRKFLPLCGFNKEKINRKVRLNEILNGLDISTSQLLKRGLSLEDQFKTLRPGQSEKVGELLYPLANFDDKSQLGNIGQVGAINFEGVADLGSLRDINRHRSTERFFPILEDEDISYLSLSNRMDIENSEYLTARPKNKEYKAHYDLIKNLIFLSKLASDFEDSEISLAERKMSRYLIPLGYPTRYFIGMSLSDLIYIASLRTKPGGHIAYRRLVYDWVQTYMAMNPYLKGAINHTAIDPEKDFYGRS